MGLDCVVAEVEFVAVAIPDCAVFTVDVQGGGGGTLHVEVG